MHYERLAAQSQALGFASPLAFMASAYIFYDDGPAGLIPVLLPTGTVLGFIAVIQGVRCLRELRGFANTDEVVYARRVARWGLIWGGLGLVGAAAVCVLFWLLMFRMQH